MGHSLKERTDEVITSVADDLREHVAKIEAGIATTQNHYGDYMNLIMSVATDDANVRKIIALALIRAGANREGVLSALKAVS